MKRIMVYSHDTYGLGNIRRMLTISEHLAQAYEDVSVLVVSGSPLLQAFRISDRLDYVKLPCLTRTGAGAYGVRALGVEYPQVIEMRQRILLSTYASFRPDVVIVDKKPFGVDDELRPVLEAATRGGHATRFVLLLRDILDAPEVTGRIWAKNDYFGAIDAYYDSVLVLGCRDVFDLPLEYGFPDRTSERVDFCGYLRRPVGCGSAQDARRRLGLDGPDPVVLVTPGGGEDGYRLGRAYLDGVTDGCGQNTTVLVTGPEMRADHREQLAADASALSSVRFLEFTDEMMSHMRAADLVVSMAGYNTITETLSAGTPAVVVPRHEPVAEQLIRAQRFAALGLLRLVHPDRLTPAVLHQAVQDAMASRAEPAATDLLDMNGLERVEKHVAALLGDE